MHTGVQNSELSVDRYVVDSVDMKGGRDNELDNKAR